MRKRKSAGPEVAERKNELKKQAKEYPRRKMAWIGGILYFIDTGGRPQEVPGAKKIPKQGKEAEGLAGAFPSASQGRGSQRPRPREEVIYFRDLPEASGTDGRCCGCGEYPNYKKTIMTADRGQQVVVECSRCHTLMRPLERRPRYSW